MFMLSLFWQANLLRVTSLYLTWIQSGGYLARKGRTIGANGRTDVKKLVSSVSGSWSLELF